MALLLPRQLSRKSAISSLLRNPRCIPYRNPIAFARNKALTTIGTYVPQNDSAALSSVFTDEVSRDILDFWFADYGLHPTKEQVMRWFVADSKFDEKCRSKFSSVLSKLVVHPSSSIISLATSPERSLSLILLLDQIPRNIFRGDLSSIVYTKTDPLAVAVTLHSLSSSLCYDFGPSNIWKAITSRRIWFLLPLTHSEDLALHKQTNEELVMGLLDDCIEDSSEGGPRPTKLAMTFQEQAKEHMAIIDRFGRYPYRNKVLGRENTPEERAWLENPGISWVR